MEFNTKNKFVSTLWQHWKNTNDLDILKGMLIAGFKSQNQPDRGRERDRQIDLEFNVRRIN